MELGKRIIYDKNTGKPLNGFLDERVDTGLTNEMLSELRPPEIDYIDIPYGALTNAKEYHVDVANKTLVIDEYFPIEKTEEQMRIEELENQLLLAVDSQVGGIL